MFEKFDMMECTPQTIPLPVEILLSTTNSLEIQQEIEGMKKILYHEVLELLMWLQVTTHSNLLFIVNYLSYFAFNSGKVHWDAMKHAMAYIKSTISYRITYHYGESLQPIDFINSNYENDWDTRSSMDGHVIYVGRRPVSELQIIDSV